MINRKRTQRILWYESLGFLFLIALSWLNELLSLPHLIFGGGAHSNWHEAAMESTALLIVWGVVIVFTKRLMRRLFYLDGFLRVCAWCRKIGHEDEWTTLEDYFSRDSRLKPLMGCVLNAWRSGPRKPKNWRPNLAMELTASRRPIQLYMTSTRQFAATRAPARGSSSCYR